MDIFGLSALDRLFCFMIVRELQNFSKYLQRNLMKTVAFVKQLNEFQRDMGNGNATICKSAVVLYLKCHYIIYWFYF